MSGVLLVIIGVLSVPAFALTVWYVLLPQWRHIDREWLTPAAPAAVAADEDEAGGSKRSRKARRRAKREAARDAAAAPVDTGRTGYDWRPLVVLVVTCIGLTIQEYIGERTTFADWFPQAFTGEYGLLTSFGWWTGWRVIGYVMLPVIAIWCLPGERVRDYFISPKNFMRHLPIYLGLFAAVLPAVLIASQNKSFYLTYPFYKLANRSAFDLWVWEAMYAVQFLSLEFFFRGFLLKALAPRFGSAAIFVMVVPYCMIHYGKPMAETFGAIIAGTILGTLALRTKSIWGGVLIHVGVAITMDILAVGHCPPAESGLRCPGH